MRTPEAVVEEQLAALVAEMVAFFEGDRPAFKTADWHKDARRVLANWETQKEEDDARA